MLAKASNKGIISSLLSSLILPGGVISLQYADDTILFLEPSINNARNVKWLLACFDQLSSMKINFSKCDLLSIHVEDEVLNLFAQIFCCKKIDFPLKYIGVPLHLTNFWLEGEAD